MRALEVVIGLIKHASALMSYAVLAVALRAARALNRATAGRARATQSQTAIARTFAVRGSVTGRDVTGLCNRRRTGDTPAAHAAQSTNFTLSPLPAAASLLVAALALALDAAALSLAAFTIIGWSGGWLACAQCCGFLR